ncbi:MAG: tetratricopeptide repeat protein [Clostridia bacterium]|nr:tetratricopeptide repeat protein [Clostridia bacterium]
MMKRGLIIVLIWMATTAALSAQDKAVEILKTAIDLNNQKQYDASLELCNRALHIAPDLSSAWFLRGYNHYCLEKYQQAIDDFSVALHYQPKYADAFYYRGKAQQYNGNYYNALLDLNKARQLDPGRATILTLRSIFSSTKSNVSK